MKHVLLIRPNEIVISAPTTPTTLMFKEEKPTLRGDDIISPLANVPVGELPEEEPLVSLLRLQRYGLGRAGGSGDEFHL